MRSAIYIRVSIEDPHCQRQLRELRQYCGNRHWTIFREYVDSDWRGTTDSRPELDRLMEDAAQYCFDIVLVWKLDRFGRSLHHSIQQLGALSSYGIPFIATSQGLDTSPANPTSRMLLPILTAVAEFERELIRERVKAGMDAAKHKGVKFGRPRVVFDRKRAIAMHQRGVSLRVIAAKLGVGKSAVGRLVNADPAGPKP